MRHTLEEWRLIEFRRKKIFFARMYGATWQDCMRMTGWSLQKVVANHRIIYNRRTKQL